MRYKTNFYLQNCYVCDRFFGSYIFTTLFQFYHCVISYYCHIHLRDNNINLHF